MSVVRVAAFFAVAMCLRLRPVARPITVAVTPRSSMVCTAAASSRGVRPSRARPVAAMVIAVSRAVAKVGSDQARQREAGGAGGGLPAAAVDRDMRHAWAEVVLRDRPDGD